MPPITRVRCSGPAPGELAEELRQQTLAALSAWLRRAEASFIEPRFDLELSKLLQVSKQPAGSPESAWPVSPRQADIPTFCMRVEQGVRVDCKDIAGPGLWLVLVEEAGV